MYNTCDPEKAYKSCNKKKHFPFSDFGTVQMAFGKYNADDQKNSEFRQMENLKARYIVNEFNLFQFCAEYPENYINKQFPK